MKLANKDKLKKDDRILEIKVIDDKKPLSSIGLVDKRLFKGGNTLHAFFNPQTGFWRVRYDVGTIPQPLDNSWNNFDQLLTDVNKYFSERNLYIDKVLD